MKTIKMNLGYETTVDDEDYDALSAMKWFAMKEPKSKTVYACRSEHVPGSGLKNRKSYGISMHRVIMGLTHGDGMNVDHIDGNGLNNVRSNLRVARRLGLNVANCGLRPNNTTGFKGVSRRSSYFEANIRVEGVSRFLGCFKDPRLAAAAYDEAAIREFGEFAKTNKMLGLI